MLLEHCTNKRYLEKVRLLLPLPNIRSIDIRKCEICRPRGPPQSGVSGHRGGSTVQPFLLGGGGGGGVEAAVGVAGGAGEGGVGGVGGRAGAGREGLIFE